MKAEERWPGVCHFLPIARSTLDRYQRSIGAADLESALVCLARAIAHSPTWENHLLPEALVVRCDEQPGLAFFGSLDPASRDRIALLGSELAEAASRLEFLSFGAARSEITRLAERLIEHLGPEELAEYRFFAVPRGGLIVLGMLAYELGLDRERVVTEPSKASEPLVVVDDCALSGARTAQILEASTSRRVVLAHLRSHPEFRSALLEKEDRVVECIAAADLASRGEDLEAARERWLARLPESRYWAGSTEPVAFEWSEPDRLLWNGSSERIELGFNLLPPESCLRHRLPAWFPVCRQPEAEGDHAPGVGVICAELETAVLIAHMEEGTAFRLEDTAAQLWTALLAGGERAARQCAEELGSPASTAREEVGAFRDQLLEAGLLQRR